jgi:hypothetical protein
VFAPDAPVKIPSLVRRAGAFSCYAQNMIDHISNIVAASIEAKRRYFVQAAEVAGD